MSYIALQQSTQDLIDEEPTMIALVRTGWVDDGAGGKKKGAVPVQLPAVPRFFSPVARERQVAINDQGNRVVRRFVLIGLVDDDIQEGDTFTLDNIVYKVDFVDEDRRYQTRAEVIHAS